MTKIELQGEEITTFHSFRQWQERRAVLHSQMDVIICVDNAGGVCGSTRDWEFARDNDLFPVKAYRLKRTGA